MKLHVVEIEKGHSVVKKDTTGDFTREELEMIAHRFNNHEEFKTLLRDSTNILTGLMQEHQIIDTDCPTTFSHRTLQHLTRQRKVNKQALKEAEKE